MLESLQSHFNVKACIVWKKRPPGLGWWVRPQWEQIFLCTKGKPPLPLKASGDVWEFSRLVKPNHPCEKPITLMRRAIELVAPRRSIVCDPFAGIGSTGVAAILEGCRFIGVEIDPRHAALARRRLFCTLEDEGQGCPSH